MDIIKPTSLANNTGATFPWSTCASSRELTQSLVMPYIKSFLYPRFGQTVHVDKAPSGENIAPVTYVVGGSQETWPVERSEIRERFKTQGTKKQFESDRRAGNIVLKPMLNCTVFGTATPKIVDWTSMSGANHNFTAEFFGGRLGGHCHPAYTAYPALECDAPYSWLVRRTHYKNVTTAPVSKDELQRVMRLVKAKLDKIRPNQSLVTQVVSQANSATWDIATEIGEAPETIKYILDTIKRGINLCLRAKRDIKRNLAQGVTDAASTWMEYRYAIMPIIYSVNDALDVLGMDAVQFQSFRGRKDTPLYEEGDTVGGYTVRFAPSFNDRIFLKYKYDVDSSIHHGLKINYMATAWELLPLSFVFDWFFQVGDYLTAAFQPSVVSQYGCQQSVRCKGPMVLEGNSSEVLTLDIDYYRARIINPNAFIGINSDVFISFKRTMDALALAWLIFSGKNRRG